MASSSQQRIRTLSSPMMFCCINPKGHCVKKMSLCMCVVRFAVVITHLLYVCMYDMPIVLLLVLLAKTPDHPLEYRPTHSALQTRHALKDRSTYRNAYIIHTYIHTFSRTIHTYIVGKGKIQRHRYANMTCYKCMAVTSAVTAEGSFHIRYPLGDLYV